MQLMMALLFAIVVGVCSSVALAQTPEPANVFKDCTKYLYRCPSMVVVPAGSFTMGSPPSEKGRDSGFGESPQHQVTILKPFAVGQFAVTFDEWDACAADGGCNGYLPNGRLWGRGRHPVISVSWDDAKAYVAWLSNYTGKPYRLLSEAEREYVTRAGTTTAYWWGNDIGNGNANCDGCGSQWDNKERAPVDSFNPNPWGLYQVSGNVWEWVEDCGHLFYYGAPSDGSAWTEPDCIQRVQRGGAWVYRPSFLRSASRAYITVNRCQYCGFRVARALIP
jgi:formylglycine-generating enzyme required for sulfatase activity